MADEKINLKTEVKNEHNDSGTAAAIVRDVNKGKLISYNEEHFSLGKWVKDVVGTKNNQPVIGRMRERMREIKKMSQARHVRVTHGNKNVWTTIPPQIYISDLSGVVENGVAIITYSLYAMDGHNKKATVDTGSDPNIPGKEVVRNVQYDLSKEVVETIAYGQPIKVEYIDMVGVN